jgi:hypothetical protein
MGAHVEGVDPPTAASQSPLDLVVNRVDIFQAHFAQGDAALVGDHDARDARLVEPAHRHAATGYQP